MQSDIAPVLSTPDFVVRPLVPVSIAFQQQTTEPPQTQESIEEWLKGLTERSKYFEKVTAQFYVNFVFMEQNA